MSGVCYCKTCGRYIKSLGIAMHRSAHRTRREICTITYTNGDTYTHDFTKYKAGRVVDGKVIPFADGKADR